VRRCPGGGRLADARTPRKWPRDSCQAKNNFWDFSGAASRLQFPLPPFEQLDEFGVGLSYHLIAKLEDEADASS